MTVNNLTDAKWMTKPISLEDWKAQCQASSHRQGKEVVKYTTSERYAMVYAAVIVNRHVSVSLGCYWIKGDGQGIKPGTGWVHA